MLRKLLHGGVALLLSSSLAFAQPLSDLPISYGSAGGGSSGGATSPGGSNTQLQYNNAGAFGGITGATTDGTSVTLTSPTFVTPALGTPASGVATNLTGTAAGLSIGGNAATATSATSATTATNIAGGAAGQLARQTGAGATGFTTATFPTTAGTSGNVLTSDGTNWTSAAPAVTVTGSTWTPSMYGSTTPGTTTYNTQSGNWRKVCQSTSCVLTLNGYVRATQGGTAAGDVIIGDLPETLPNNVWAASCTIGYMQGWTFAGGSQLILNGIQNTSTLRLMFGGSGLSLVTLPVTGWAGNAIMQFSCAINY